MAAYWRYGHFELMLQKIRHCCNDVAYQIAIMEFTYLFILISELSGTLTGTEK